MAGFTGEKSLPEDMARMAMPRFATPTFIPPRPVLQGTVRRLVTIEQGQVGNQTLLN